MSFLNEQQEEYARGLEARMPKACDVCGATSLRVVRDEDGTWKSFEMPFIVCCVCGAEVPPEEGK